MTLTDRAVPVQEMRLEGVLRNPYAMLSCLTLLLRVPALLALASRHLHAFASEGNDGYFQIAQNIVQRGIIGLDEHHLLTRGPLYPILLLPGMWVHLPVVWTLLVNLAASVGICLLVYEACLLWSELKPAAVAGALVVSANPWLIWCVKNPTPTVTATFLTALAGYLLARLALCSGRRCSALCLCLGGTCGLAALDHTALIALLAGVTMALVILRWRDRPVPRLVNVAVLWIGFALVIAPYTYRNFQITKRFVPVADSAGFSYFMGIGMFDSSIYPSGDIRDFSRVSSRLHLPLKDLGIQFYTLDDRYYPELSTLAKQDFRSTLRERPGYLAERTIIMSLWFWFAGDKFAWLTLAHCAYWAIFAIGMVAAWSRCGVLKVAPFAVVALPAAFLHGLTMPLIGYAGYSIPYCALLVVPISMSLKGIQFLDRAL